MLFLNTYRPFSQSRCYYVWYWSLGHEKCKQNINVRRDRSAGIYTDRAIIPVVTPCIALQSRAKSM